MMYWSYPVVIINGNWQWIQFSAICNKERRRGERFIWIQEKEKIFQEPYFSTYIFTYIYISSWASLTFPSLIHILNVKKHNLHISKGKLMYKIASSQIH